MLFRPKQTDQPQNSISYNYNKHAVETHINMSVRRNAQNTSNIITVDSGPLEKKRRMVAYSIGSASQPTPSTSGLDHDYVGASFSQRTTRPSIDQGSSQEEKQLISTIIKYILLTDKTHKFVNKSRIVKHALGGCGRNFHPLMLKVKNVLQKTFGYKLVEYETNKYIVVNTIQNSQPHIALTPNQSAQQTLLFLVLTHIFMNDETTSEDMLWEFLRHLGIVTKESARHEYFGDVQQLITQDFVNQKYLEKVVVKEDDPPKHEYRWGVRAEYEFSRRSALEFVSKVFNNKSLDTWAPQYKSVLAREGELSTR